MTRIPQLEPFGGSVVSYISEQFLTLNTFRYPRWLGDISRNHGSPIFVIICFNSRSQGVHDKIWFGFSYSQRPKPYSTGNQKYQEPKQDRPILRGEVSSWKWISPCDSTQHDYSLLTGFLTSQTPCRALSPMRCNFRVQFKSVSWCI